MFENILKCWLNDLLFAFFAVIGIFSFSGIEIGSPYQFSQTESIELLFSKKETEKNIYVIHIPEKPKLSLPKRANFKWKISVENTLEKTCFNQFSKKEIPIQFLFKRIFSSLKISDEFPSSSIQG